MIKILSSFLVACLILMSVTTSVVAIDSKASDISAINRVYGENRFQTARSIAELVNNGKTKNVILTSGNIFPDALSASVLAHKLNAPILLTDSSVAASSDAFDYINSHLDPSGTVYIVGGEGIISSEFVSRVVQMGFNSVKRIGGQDRYDTNQKIVQELNPTQGTTIIVSSGENYPDALSISSIAAYNGWPIFLVEPNSLPSIIRDAIAQTKPSKIFITGGVGAVSANVESEIHNLLPDASIERLEGLSRFDTSARIAQIFSPEPEKVYLASGYGFADALAGSVLAAQTGSPIILVDPNSSKIPRAAQVYLSGLSTQKISPTVMAFGGTGVVPELTLNDAKHLNNLQFEQGAGYAKGSYDLKSPQPTASNWSRQSNFLGPAFPKLKWRHITPGAIYDQPILGSDGTIYINNHPSTMGGTDDKLTAINPDDSKKWELPGILTNEPVIASDGTIYITPVISGGNEPLWAVKPDGSKKWEFSTKAQSLSAPAIGTNGTIYLTSFGGSFGDSKLYALTPDGRQLWEFQTEEVYELGNNPAIGEDGTIFVSGISRLEFDPEDYSNSKYLSSKSPLYAINPDGTKKWELTLDGYNLCDLAIGQNGTIYLNEYSRKTLYAINPDGTKKWEFRHDNLVEEAPSIATDGTIYLGGQNLYAINPDGTLKWVLESKNLTCPVIGLDGTLYSASSNGDIYSLNSDGTTQWVFGNRAGGTAPPTLGANGIIYFGSRDHGLYAIDSDLTKTGKAGSQ